jgi:hypothetical protein
MDGNLQEEILNYLRPMVKTSEFPSSSPLHIVERGKG